MLRELIYTLLNCQQSMVSELHQFCEINTGTANLKGLKKMETALKQAFSKIADDIQVIKSPLTTSFNMQGESMTQQYGNSLLIRKRPLLKRRILLCGHMDTVYDVNHPFQTLTYKSENILCGPGVADMKGGLVVMIHALNAFENLPDALTLGWDVFINADEEIGSIASSQLITQLAPKYQSILIYEPSMTPDGDFAKNRKGSMKYTIIAKGHAAHSGRDFSSGRNAICYLAEVITCINQLNEKRDGVTLNIGKILGGSSVNTVPETAVAKIDIRISKDEDASWVSQQLDKINNQLKRPGFELKIEGGLSRPVKRINAATKRLYELIQLHGKQLSLDINWKDSGGCCDGNNFAQYDIPVIDTLGVRGGHIHSSEEYILLDSLVERATLSGLLIADLASGSLENLQNNGKQT